MASNKTAGRKSRSSTRSRARGTTGKPPAVLKLTKKARREVADLLRRSRAGILRKHELRTELKEVKAQLGVVEDFIFDFRNW